MDIFSRASRRVASLLRLSCSFKAGIAPQEASSTTSLDSILSVSCLLGVPRISTSIEYGKLALPQSTPEYMGRYELNFRGTDGAESNNELIAGLHFRKKK